ncbi:hypothetical protein Tco_0720927 [Tanacetum coccineum]
MRMMMRDEVEDGEGEEEHPAPATFCPTVHRIDRTIGRDDPYSIETIGVDLYGFVDMVDVPPRCSMSRELDYDITDTWDDLVGAIDGDYAIGPPRWGQSDGDRPVHRRLAVMIERERLRWLVRTWGLSMDASDYATFRCLSLRTTTTENQVQLTKTLWLLKGYRHSMVAFSEKMAPKRKTTRLNPGATPTPVTDTHTTTSVTNAQIQAMINEGVTAALAARDATRNGDDSHTSGTGARRPVQVARECTYPDFLKCHP